MDRSPSGSPSPAKEAMRTNKTRSHPSQTHSPPSTSSTKSTTSNDDSPPEDNSAVVVASEKRQSAPLSRRGHVKSRLGCFSCKRRRVKCNELRPSCSSCRRLGLRCEYPAQAPDISAESGPVTMLTPQAPLTGLKLEDLRFYHQFLTVGHPTLPLQSSWVWSQAAAMSHQHDFLAHALLGLGAAHVTQNNPGIDYTASALQHRLTAIKRVNEELDRPQRTSQEADALMAAVTCLVAQSSLLPNVESMIEYLTMSRGGNLVLSQLLPDIEKSLFRGMSMEGHIGTLQRLITDQPKDWELLDQFEASVLGIRPLCPTDNEIKYMNALVRCSTALRASTLNAWYEFVIVWLMPTTFSNQDFLEFVAPDNHGARLLIVHCFLLDYVLGQFCISQDLVPPCHGRKNVIISWTRGVAAALPAELKGYAEWMLQYCDVLDKQDPRYLLSP